MDRQTAEDLMAALVELDGPFSKAAEVTLRIEDREERVKIREGLGGVIGRVYTEVMMPILKQYPDLDPDRGK